eukprot:TRINITY_DN4529_c0_g1_i3.p1 TRINITY_DN4529_c0_g1~~TRINITY_DN4529_c0_g1_i3.p1  ORF type:complete len:475 (-),score=40.19 TRINITY_DN4529_c0_g1_i3:280-1704(-)
MTFRFRSLLCPRSMTFRFLLEVFLLALLPEVHGDDLFESQPCPDGAVQSADGRVCCPASCPACGGRRLCARGLQADLCCGTRIENPVSGFLPNFCGAPGAIAPCVLSAGLPSCPELWSGSLAGVCAVVPVDEKRLWKTFPQLSRSWRGTLGVGLLVDETRTVEQLKQLYSTKALAGGGVCHPGRVSLQVISSAKFAGRFPFNHLRNKAVSACGEAEHLLVMDADFELYPGALALRSALSLVRPRTAVVLPAFQLTKWFAKKYNFLMSASRPWATKTEIAELVRRRTAGPIGTGYSPGFRQTRYERWYNTSVPYSISYKPGYEPYLLMRRGDMLPFDESIFLGWDKISFVHELAASGVNFMVSPEAFLVHTQVHSHFYEKSHTYLKETCVGPDGSSSDVPFRPYFLGLSCLNKFFARVKRTYGKDLMENRSDAFVRILQRKLPKATRCFPRCFSEMMLPQAVGVESLLELRGGLL